MSKNVAEQPRSPTNPASLTHQDDLLPEFVIEAIREKEERDLRDAEAAARQKRREELDQARKPLNSYLEQFFEACGMAWPAPSPHPYDSKTIEEIAGRMMELRSQLVREPLASNTDKIKYDQLPAADRYGKKATECGILLLKHVRDGKRAAIVIILEKIPEANLWAAFDVIRLPMLWDRLFFGPPTPEPESPPQQSSADEPDSTPQCDTTPTRAVRLAMLSFEYAESKVGYRLEDHEAYDHLKENGIEEGEGDCGELSDYNLPAFATWARYLREHRRATNQQKYTRRGRAKKTRSIALIRELEMPGDDSKPD